jgi:hypothetical protein
MSQIHGTPFLFLIASESCNSLPDKENDGNYDRLVFSTFWVFLPSLFGNIFVPIPHIGGRATYYHQKFLQQIEIKKRYAVLRFLLQFF